MYEERKVQDKIIHNGKTFLVVDEERYRLCEKIRNYILRERYERGTAWWLLYQKATCNFDVTESYCRMAIKEWRTWCYGNGVRHKPIELIIEEHINQQKD